MARVTTTQVNIGIDEKNRKAICDALQTLVADEFLLYAKTRSFHWNVEGPHFGALHKLFEQQYESLAVMLDQVAERMRQLGQYADGTLSTCLDRSDVEEQSGAGASDTEMLHILTEDHETAIRYLRETIDDVEEKYKDTGTADFLTNLMEKHEQMAWMLRAHLA